MNPKVYSIISLLPQNGAKYLAVNMAYTLATKRRNRDKILLINFDFDNPMLCYHLAEDDIKGLDNLESFGHEVTEEDFTNNITQSRFGFDILKGSKLGRPELFSKDLIAKIINYSKMNYDLVLITNNSNIKNPSVAISLLNSDEIILVARNTYSNAYKIRKLINSISIFSRGNAIKIIENYNNYNNNVNIMKEISNLNVSYLGALEFDSNSIDNINIGNPSIFKRRNVNTGMFVKILQELKKGDENHF